jgi:hypothetical protein
MYISLVALSCSAVYLGVPRIAAQSRSIVPFTVVLTEVSINSSGTRVPVSTQTLALRSDGSTVRKLGPAGKGSRIISFASLVEVVVQDEMKQTSTMGLRADPVLSLRSAWSRCVANMRGGAVTRQAETVLADEQLGEYRTVKVGTKNTTSWFALDHGCAPIATRMDFGEAGASETELLALIPGEPDGSLFAIPASYREVSLSAHLREPSPNNCNAKCQEGLASRRAALEQEYQTRRIR